MSLLFYFSILSSSLISYASYSNLVSALSFCAGWKTFRTASLNSTRWPQCGCLKTRWAKFRYTRHNIQSLVWNKHQQNDQNCNASRGLLFFYSEGDCFFALMTNWMEMILLIILLTTWLLSKQVNKWIFFLCRTGFPRSSTSWKCKIVI